jgi:DNA-binding HxlR family transcriptional regulator
LERNGRSSDYAPVRADTRISREEGFHRISDILKCKWTLAILHAIGRGVNRPGQLERELDGLTPKVLYDRIRKLERYGLIVRRAYPEIPPRVEYEFTDQGLRMVELLAAIGDFVDTWHESTQSE